jgi:hypothetical protein
MTRHRLAFCLVLGLVLGATWVNGAEAYEEQASADLSLGYAGVVDSTRFSMRGGSLEGGASMGISDMFVVRTSLGYAGFLASDSLRSAGRFRVEGAYLLDILRWVPFFGVGGSLWLFDDAGLTVRPAGHVLFGLDFLFDRSWTFGLDVRTGLLWERAGVVATTEGGLRLSRMFELF